MFNSKYIDALTTKCHISRPKRLLTFDTQEIQKPLSFKMIEQPLKVMIES